MDFSKVKLRPAPKAVSKEVDLKQLNSEMELQNQQLQMINRKVREADLECWYSSLKDHTYETEFVPITLEEGKAMHRLYDARMKNVILEKEEETISGLLKKLQIVMDGFPNGCFVKLSSRSPKDASAASEKTKRIFLELLDELVKSSPTGTSEGSKYSQISNNDKLIAINKAHILALCLKDAKEVMDMFLNSERINSDLELALNFPQQWSQHLIVRKFIPIPIYLEFRGFVVNNQLRALCQYYHYLHFDELVKNKERILELIHRMFETIKDIVPIKDGTYVVDWAVDLDNDKAYIIELNPFGDYEGMGTSPAMFHLHANSIAMDRQGPDRDLFFGDRPFEFRYETAPLDTPEKVWALLHGPWRRFWYELFGGTAPAVK